MVNGFMLGAFFLPLPLEVLGRTAPRLALQEVVEVADWVFHEVSGNLVNDLQYSGRGDSRLVRV